VYSYFAIRGGILEKYVISAVAALATLTQEAIIILKTSGKEQASNKIYTLNKRNER